MAGDTKDAADVEGFVDAKALPGLKTDRTADEVVADIIAKDPAAHGLTLEERKRRAEEAARLRAAEDAKFFEGDGDGNA